MCPFFFSLRRYWPPYHFVFSFLITFYFLPYIFVILYEIHFVPELESEAKDAFREFLGTVYPGWSDRFESFFNEWKMTYTSDGPFETEHDRANINDKMTHPDDFQVWKIVLPQIRAHLIIIATKYRVRSVRKSAQLGVTLKYTPQVEAYYFFEICTSVRIVISLCQKPSIPVQKRLDEWIKTNWWFLTGFRLQA